MVCRIAVVNRALVGAFLLFSLPQNLGAAPSSAIKSMVSAGSMVHDSQETIVEMIKPMLMIIMPQSPTIIFKSLPKAGCAALTNWARVSEPYGRIEIIM